MIPEVELLSAVSLRWPSFRATMDKALKLRPEYVINNLPIELSDDCIILLNIAAFYGWQINNPLSTLRNLPPLFMEYLHYTFMLACDEHTQNQIQFHNITTINNSDIIIATGSLDSWYQLIVNNLSRNWNYSFEAKVLLCKILLTFERERGLKFIFESYKKKMQSDQTFLLEDKK